MEKRFKFTGPDELLSICTCLIKHLAPDGDVRTELVAVSVRFIPAFLY